MAQPVTFDQALDTIEQLPVDQQAEVVQVIQQRLRERARQELIEDVRKSEVEYARGEGKAVSVEELMGEITS